MNASRLAFFVLTCLLSLSATAQWQWTDKDGRKVFSDRPPPADVLEKDILKRPNARAPASPGKTDASQASVAPAAAQPANDAPALKGIDKELTAKKKKAEEAEAAKRKADEEKRLKAIAENCLRAKRAKATLDSGVRVARTNEKGEREVMDDAARASELERIQTVIASDCQSTPTSTQTQ